MNKAAIPRQLMVELQELAAEMASLQISVQPGNNVLDLIDNALAACETCAFGLGGQVHEKIMLRLGHLVGDMHPTQAMGVGMIFADLVRLAPIWAAQQASAAAGLPDA